MRIPNRTTYATLARHIDQNRGAIDRAMQQLGSGRRVAVAADDPGAARAIEVMRSAERTAEGYRASVAEGRSLLERADAALGQAGDVLVRLRELALEGANDVLTAESRAALAAEVRALREALVATANQRAGEAYLFGGFVEDQAPFAADGTTRGPTAERELVVGRGVRAAVTLSGRRVFAGEGGGGGVDVFAVAERLADALAANDGDDVSASLADLERAHGQIRGARADAGVRLMRLDQADAALEGLVLKSTARRSELADADVTRVAMELTLRQSALTSAIAVAGRVVTPSLMDFLA
jgi:flagellar hook-associated protein 3 FlgL